MKQKTFIACLTVVILLCSIIPALSEDSGIVREQEFILTTKTILEDIGGVYPVEEHPELVPSIYSVHSLPNQRGARLMLRLHLCDQDGHMVHDYNVTYTDFALPSVISLLNYNENREISLSTSNLSDESALLDAAMECLRSTLAALNNSGETLEFELYNHFVLDDGIQMVFQAPFTNSLFKENQFLSACWNKEYNIITGWYILYEPPIDYNVSNSAE